MIHNVHWTDYAKVWLETDIPSQNFLQKKEG